MSELVALAPKKLVLPFSVLSGKRKEPFTRDMEAAALFILAETERAKGGGLIMKQLEETIESIAKVCYPLWLVSWNETILIFDGLNRSNYALQYTCVPNVKTFIANLRRSAKTRETHLAFLRDHLNYFQISEPERDLLVDGLIKNAQFLGEFDVYRVEAVEVGSQNVQAGFLTHQVEESVIASEIQGLENLLVSFEEDVALLVRCMKFLNKATNHYMRMLRDKVKIVKDEFAVKIKQEEEMVAPKVDVIKDDYDSRITEVAKNFEKQRLPIQKEKVQLGQAKENVYERIDRCKLEARTHAQREDKVGEQKWKEKSDNLKKALSGIDNQLKQTDKALKDLEDRRSLEIFKLRDELEIRVKEARENLLELEASRDAKILIFKQEMEKLEKQTRSISDLVGEAVKLRESDIAHLGKLGIRKELGFEGNALCYVPFYVIRYTAEMKKRYLILPPSLVSTVGLATKLKGALGKAKIKQLLVPRFKVVSSLMDTIQLLAQQRAAFETELRELGEEYSLLAPETKGDEIRNGLLCLKNEGWLGEKEHDAVLQRLESIGRRNSA